MPPQVAVLSTPSIPSTLPAFFAHFCVMRTALAVSVCCEGRVPLTSCALRAVRKAGAAVAHDDLRHRDGHADGAGLRLGQAGEVAAELGGSEAGQRGGGRHLRSQGQGREFTGVQY